MRRQICIWLVGTMCAATGVGIHAAYSKSRSQVQLQAGRSYFNYGQSWKDWSDVNRSTYLDGFVDGQSNTFLKMSADLSAQRRKELEKATFTFYDRDILRDVMSDLYKDPANSLITYSAMVYIARDKLDGKSIEEGLRYSRQYDRGIVREK